MEASIGITAGRSTSHATNYTNSFHELVQKAATNSSLQEGFGSYSGELIALSCVRTHMEQWESFRRELRMRLRGPSRTNAVRAV
eukprot:2972130-Amphidinium_carterae.2